MERHKIIPATHIFFIKDSKILLLKRDNTGYMDGFYSVVAGHVDEGEFPKGSGIREIKEEANVEVKMDDLKFILCMPRIKPGIDERIDYFFECKAWQGEICNNEPEKCSELDWFYLEDLPQNIIPYIKKAIECYKSGISYYELEDMAEETELTTISSYKSNIENYIEKFERPGRNESMNHNMDKFVSMLKGKKVLDIGCGPGTYSNLLAQKGLDVIGIDIVEEFIEYAKQKYPKAKFKVMNMKNLDFGSGSFDGIWAFASLLHLTKKDIPSVLKSIHRIMKDSAILFLTLKFGEGERYEEDVYNPKNKRFFGFYQKEEIVNLLEEANLKILEINQNEFEGKQWLQIFATK